MARPLTIRNLLDDHRHALGELAIREYHEPDDQAAYLIVDGLRRAGVLPLDVIDYREMSTDQAPDNRSITPTTSSPDGRSAA